MTVQEAYNYSVYFLGANGVDEEEFKAKCLVCHLAKIANRDYHSHLGDLVSQKEVGGRPVAAEKRHTVAICAGGVGLFRQHICRGSRGTDPPGRRRKNWRSWLLNRSKMQERRLLYGTFAPAAAALGSALQRPVPVPVSTVWKSRQTPLLICKRTPCLLPMCALYWQISAAI